MKLPSRTNHWKGLADGGKAFLKKSGRRVWKIVQPSVRCGWDVGEKCVPRFAAKGCLLLNWWTDHGLPIAILRLAGNALLFLPVDIGWYLLASVGHGVWFKLPFLLAWLVFAGSVRAYRFYFKEIHPDHRTSRSIGKETNGRQIEGGC